jgi:type IV secretory pathway TraG/TraD family ATPase VirD4
MSDIIDSKKALYVGVSAQGYGSIARSIAKVLLSELQIRSHELGIKYEDSESAKLNPIYLIIDEAEALLYKEFINLLNKGRSSGFKITLGTQTYSDFDTISKDFTRQIKTNCSNMFVFNLGNDKDGYEDVSKSIGTLEDIKITKSTENGEATERGSERDVLRYIAHPQVLKHLPKGTCIYVRKFPFKTFALNIKDSKTLKSLATRSNRHIRRPINDDINPRMIAESKKEKLIKVAMENSEEFNTNIN